MKKYSGSRSVSKGLAIIGLCVALPVDGFAQHVQLPTAYTGALTSDVMSMAALDSGFPAPQATGAAIGDGSETAYTAAVADGITTGIGLSAGAAEMNPLISPSPLGIVAMTGLKIGLIKYAETLPEEDKRTALKTGSAIWSGAAVNNLLVLAAAPTPLSIIAGIAMGVATWMHMDNQYQEQDRIAALRAAQAVPVAVAPAAAEPVLQAESKNIVAVEAKGEMSSGE